MSPALIGAGVALLAHVAIGLVASAVVGDFGPRSLALGGWHAGLSLMAGTGAALIVAGLSG